MTSLLAPPRDPYKYAPVVVLAPARSCSSVVSAMLGSHPGLYGFPELLLFSEATVGEVLDAPPYLPSVLTPEARANWRAAPGLRRAVAQVLRGGQGNTEMAWAERYLQARRYWPGAALFDELLGALTPTVGVEKSPETVRSAENLQRVREWFPRARLLHLVRHPVAYVRSLQVHLMVFDHPEVCARGWLSTNNRIEDFCASLPPSQTLRVRAEDVLAGDREVLASLARLAGVVDDEAALDAMLHPERSPYAGTPEAARLGGMDAGFLSNPILRPPAEHPSLEPLLACGISATVASEVAELASRYGYS